MEYAPRVIDSELKRRLSSARVIVLEGPKACGKTESARQIAGSEVLLDTDEAAKQAASISPSLVLEGPIPRLIDEWQIEPKIWNHIRRLVDDRNDTGQFILTGSSVPADDINRHTGAGRFSFIRMRPMTLFECGHSDRAISLAALMDGQAPHSSESSLTIPDLANLITVGGWPAQQGSAVEDAAQAARDYLTQISQVDISLVAGGHRDPYKVGQLLKSLARNVATEVAITTLATDAGGSEGPLSQKSVVEYLYVLERLMIIEDQPAWAPHMRSKATLRSASKRHFVDPSLAVAALAGSPARLLGDPNLLGFLFESLAIRDLRVFSQSLDGLVFHYRDSNGLEVDAIVQLANGRWAAFEIKLGIGSVDAGAATLLKFADLVDTDKCGKPISLTVISGTGYGYMRDDGVGVVPIGALSP